MSLGVVGVLQAVSEKSAPVNGAAGTGDNPGPPQLEEPATFVNLSDIGIVVVVVGAAVVVVAPAVVVVVPPGHVGPLPGNGQASQQLPHTPTVPPFAVQASALFLLLQLVTPFLFVMQQVTNPGLPHTDFAAHFFTFPLHDFGSMLLVTEVLADCATQLTYAPWSGALAHGPHACSAASRAAAVIEPVGSSAAQFADANRALAKSNTSARGTRVGIFIEGPPSFSERFVQGFHAHSYARVEGSDIPTSWEAHRLPRRDTPSRHQSQVNRAACERALPRHGEPHGACFPSRPLP